MRKTTRIALLPILIGLIVSTRHFFPQKGPMDWWPDVVGGYYLLTGVFLWIRPSRLSQGLAIVAYIPLVLGKPLMALGVIRTLQSDNPNFIPAKPTAPPKEADLPEGRTSLLCGALRSALGIADADKRPELSFRDHYVVPEGHILDFLDGLHRCYCFDISADDGKQIDSLKDLLSLLEVRHPYSK